MSLLSTPQLDAGHLFQPLFQCSSCFTAFLGRLRVKNTVEKRPHSHGTTFSRICPTKAATGTRDASSVPNAVDHWWRNHLLPRTRSCCVLSATLMSIHPSVSTARRPSCLVRQKEPFSGRGNCIFNCNHSLV